MNHNLNLNDLFSQIKTIAVVGLSDNPSRPSFDIAKYLQSQGYLIVPVNPNASEILGQPCYPDLKSIPFPIDIVNVFRKSEDCAAIAQEAVSIHPKCLWLQSGIVNLEAQEIARKAGVLFTMDRCIKVDHRSWLNSKK